jgi:hypothetical protein
MKQKNTVYMPSFHNQYQETSDEIDKNKFENAEHSKRDEKQGQSKFRVGKIIKELRK